jgi:hypothetical protein
MTTGEILVTCFDMVRWYTYSITNNSIVFCVVVLHFKAVEKTDAQLQLPPCYYWGFLHLPSAAGPS